MSEVDGRRERGDRRRRAIAESALAVIGEQGVGALSHRAVARAAGVPTSSTTYHFASLEELLESALLLGMEECLETLRKHRAKARGATAEEVLARVVVDLASDRARSAALYQVYLEAATRPQLRPVAEQWADELHDLVQLLVPDTALARLVAAALDGLVLESLVSRRKPSRSQLTEVFASALGGPASRSRS